MRFRLRTLLIVLALGPLAVWGLFWLFVVMFVGLRGL